MVIQNRPGTGLPCMAKLSVTAKQPNLLALKHIQFWTILIERAIFDPGFLIYFFNFLKK